VVKATDTKSSAHQSQQSQQTQGQPFFNKEGGDVFFQPEAEQATPFFVQPKLNVTQPGDALEEEADRTAEDLVQRKPIFDSMAAADEPEENIQRKSEEEKEASEQEQYLQMKEEPEKKDDEELLQRKPVFDSMAEPAEEQAEEQSLQMKEEPERKDDEERLLQREESPDAVQPPPVPSSAQAAAAATPPPSGSAPLTFPKEKNQAFDFKLAPQQEGMDWFSMTRPFSARGAEHLQPGSADAINQRWMQTYMLTQGLLGPSLATRAANMATPMAVDNALKRDYPTRSEQTDQALGSSPVGGSVTLFQFKLTVNTPQDKYEKEADAVADEIVRRDATTDKTTPTLTDGASLLPRISRLDSNAPGSERNTGQAAQLKPGLPAAERDTRTGSSSVEERLAASKGSGAPLPDDTRVAMEGPLGAKLDNVRVHTGSNAVQMNKDLRAQAFTNGRDIYFNEGKFNPGSADGKRLLAHELTHVVQQTGAEGKATERSAAPVEDKAAVTAADSSKPAAGKEAVTAEQPAVNQKANNQPATEGSADGSADGAGVNGETAVMAPAPESPAAASAIAALPGAKAGGSGIDKGPELAVDASKVAPMPSFEELLGSVPDEEPASAAEQTGSATGEDLTPPPEENNGGEALNIQRQQEDGEEGNFMPEMQASETAADSEEEAGPQSVFSADGIIQQISAHAQARQQQVQQEADAVKADAILQGNLLRNTLLGIVEEKRNTLRANFAARRVALETTITTADGQITERLTQRTASVEMAGQSSKDRLTAIFADHETNLDTLAEDKVTEVEDMTTTSQETVNNRVTEQVAAARTQGAQKAASFPSDERGMEQRNAAIGVANETAREIESKRPELLDAIAELTADIPASFVEQATEAKSGLADTLQELHDNVDDQVADAISTLEDQADQARDLLQQQAESAREQLDNQEQQVMDQLDQYALQVEDQVTSGVDEAIAQTDAALPDVITQLQQIEAESTATLSAVEDPDPAAAQDFGNEVMAYLSQVADTAIGGFRETAAVLSGTFAEKVGTTQQALNNMEADVETQLQQFDEGVDTSIEELLQNLDTSFDDITTGLAESFSESESSAETELQTSYTDLESAFNETISETRTKIDEAVNEGLAKNDEALAGLGAKMQEAADDAAWDYDHPVLSTIRDVGMFIVGVIAALVVLIAVAIVVVLAFKAIVAGLIFLGLSAAVAEFIVALAAIALIAYGVYEAYQARMERGAAGGWGTFGMALLDTIGVTDIYNAFAQDGLSPFQRGWLFGEGVFKFVTTILMVRGAWKFVRSGGLRNAWQGLFRRRPFRWGGFGRRARAIGRWARSGIRSVGRMIGSAGRSIARGLRSAGRAIRDFFRDPLNRRDTRGRSPARRLDTGAKTGEPATPETIRQGTVAMEDHPQYAELMAEVRNKGFEVREIPGDPHVSVVEVVNEAGEVIRVEKVLFVRRGMRFLDLEHEVGHIRQVTERFGADKVLPTERVMEYPDGRRKVLTSGEFMTEWQNPIVEYHNRLVEFIRLAERGADESLLREHARGVAEWRQAYWNKGLKGGRSPSRREWTNTHFGDIGELQTRYNQLGGSGYER
jgi:Uncharacterized conserved protein